MPRKIRHQAVIAILASIGTVELLLRPFHSRSGSLVQLSFPLQSNGCPNVSWMKTKMKRKINYPAKLLQRWAHLDTFNLY